MSDKYVAELLNILKEDERVVNRFEIVAYMPYFNYEKTVTLKDGDYSEKVQETFDIFKVKKLGDDKELYLHYGDYDTLSYSNLDTLMRYCKTCIAR